MGRIEKGTKCNVIGCEGVAIRSLSIDKVESSGLKMQDTKRAYLCTGHYKEYKRKSKGTRRIERWRWGA